MGPPWPYPRIETRKPNGSHLSFGIGMVVACGLAWILCGVFLPETLKRAFQGKRRGYSAFSVGSTLGFAVAGIGGFLGLCGIALIVDGAKKRATTAHLTREGARCWGRVISVTATGKKNLRSGTNTTWLEHTVVVDVFAAAPTEGAAGGSYRQAPGTLVAERVSIPWFIADTQIALVQPDGWCALLLLPSDPARVYLDGFAMPDGRFVAAAP